MSEILAKKEQWLSVDETSLAGSVVKVNIRILRGDGSLDWNAVRDNIALTYYIVKRKAKQFATLGEFEFVNIEQTWIMCRNKDITELTMYITIIRYTM